MDKQLSKEAILENQLSTVMLSIGYISNATTAIPAKIYEAMSIHSKQMSIAFEQWKLREGWLPEEKIEIFRNTVYGNMNHDDRLTIEQLYELFLTNNK